MEVKRREQSFFYSTGWSDPVAVINGAVTQTISIAEDAPFKCYYLTLHIRQGVLGAELIVLNFAGTIQITDTQIGKTLFNVAAPCDAIRSNGELPYNLAPPRIFASNTNVVIVTTSNVATRTEVAVVLHGAKLLPVN